MESDTICAISTAPGSGAIAVIRLTGINAITITDKVFTAAKQGLKLANAPGNTIHFGTIGSNNNIIDEVLVSVFKQPRSFTGQNMAEISCHGSAYIQQQIVNLLIKNGARMALPGEFTQRAYLNGKMDLAQAEAVADLIASGSSAAHKIAIDQMRGGISNQLTELRQQLVEFIALIELELDFSEEEVEFADRDQLLTLLDNINTVIDKLITSFELGNAIKNGVPVAIVGQPNVGKSTLLNAILNDEKAIVSEIAGTTRDTIEDTFIHNGINFRFIDTAGLRTATDSIEKIGIERTYKTIDKAKIVLALFNATDTLQNIKKTLVSLQKRAGADKKIIAVINKTDLTNTPQTFGTINGAQKVYISAKNKQGIDHLLKTIGHELGADTLDNNDVVVSNLRHLQGLQNAQNALQRARTGLINKVSNDFTAMDIREVIHHLSGITGNEITTDEVLGLIFSRFCIGK